MFVLLKYMDKLRLGYIYPHTQDRVGLQRVEKGVKVPVFPLLYKWE